MGELFCFCSLSKLNKNEKNGINKTHVDGVKTKVLVRHYQRLGRPERPSAGPQHERNPHKSALFTPVWRKCKSQKAKITMRNLSSNCSGQWGRQINQDED